VDTNIQLGKQVSPINELKTVAKAGLFFVSLYLILIGLIGCASLSGNSKNAVLSQLDEGKLAILASCEFYNAEGQVIRKYPGDICVPVENGDLYLSDTVRLTKFNKHNQVLWSLLEPVHHQMKRSFNKRDILFISGYYEATDSIPIRHDVVKVADSDGNILKQFDFASYLNKLDPELKKRYKYKNSWNFNGTKRPFFEYTHVNSIDEIVSRDQKGQEKLDGYVVNDLNLKKVFFFDSELKLITALDFSFESMHDVSFLDQDTLVYFVNSSRDNPKRSAVATYNVETKKKTLIYGTEGPAFYSKHNGGVQPISPDMFLISIAPRPSASYVEIISNRGQVLRRIPLRGTRKLIQDAELADYREFLKNNIGN
jgi:hypothetical protein